MKNFTYPQLFMTIEKARKREMDRLELQARLVWAVANGWKRPTEVKGPGDLKALGKMLEER